MAYLDLDDDLHTPRKPNGDLADWDEIQDHWAARDRFLTQSTSDLVSEIICLDDQATALTNWGTARRRHKVPAEARCAAG